jgi:hypothetical protein
MILLARISLFPVFAMVLKSKLLHIRRQNALQDIAALIENLYWLGPLYRKLKCNLLA